jgi:hypothetical protein
MTNRKSVFVPLEGGRCVHVGLTGNGQFVDVVEQNGCVRARFPRHALDRALDQEDAEGRQERGISHASAAPSMIGARIAHRALFVGAIAGGCIGVALGLALARRISAGTGSLSAHIGGWLGFCDGSSSSHLSSTDARGTSAQHWSCRDGCLARRPLGWATAPAGLMAHAEESRQTPYPQ